MTQIRLDWSGSTSVGSADVGGYHVYRSGSGSAWTRIATLDSGATGYSDTHLRRLTLYRYKVNPFNVTGEASDGDVIGVWTGSGASVSSVPKTSILFSSAPVTAAAGLTNAAPITGRLSGALALSEIRRELLQLA
jgi:hypothetical protein